MTREQRLERTEKVEHMIALLHACELDHRRHTGHKTRRTTIGTFHWTDGDENAGETSAVKSKIQPMKPSDQEIAEHEACGHYPYRDWYPVCVDGAGR